MLRHLGVLAGLALLLAACAAPREPVQSAAAVPEVEKPAAAPPPVSRAGAYQADLVATEFAADPAAHGQASFWLSEDGTRLHYRVTVGRLGAATAVHMHLTAEAGSWQRVPHYGQPPLAEDAHGPIIVTLMRFKRGGVAAEGVLVRGEIADADLVGPLKAQPLRRLVEHLDRGEAYVTVHVRQRLASGQIFCCPDGLRGRVGGTGS